MLSRTFYNSLHISPPSEQSANFPLTTVLSAATPSAPPTLAAAAPAMYSRLKTRKPLAKPKRLATREPLPSTRKTRTTCICTTCCIRRGHIMVVVTRRIRRIRKKRRRRRLSARDKLAMATRRMKRASRNWGGRRRGGISCLERRTRQTRRRRRGRGVRRGRVGMVCRKAGWVVVRSKRGIQLEGLVGAQQR